MVGMDKHEHKNCCHADDSAVAPETAKDPMCGMNVNVAAPKGGTHEHDGTTFYFCNLKCPREVCGRARQIFDTD